MRPSSGHRTGKHRGFGLLAALARLPASLMTRWDVPEVLPVPAPAIFAGNHRSLFDVVVGFKTFWSCRASMRIVVARRYFDHWLMGRLLRVGGCIPMDSGRAGLGGVKAALAALERGESVVIMPEGRVISPEERTGGVGPPGQGVGILVARSTAPVALCAIRGSDEVWPRGRRWPRIRFGRARPTVSVVVESMTPLAPAQRRDRKAVADAVMAGLAHLLARSEEADEAARTACGKVG